MAKQLLWRGHLSLVEQPNGYFTVVASEFFTGDYEGEETSYPNLSWAESSDVVQAVLDQWVTSSKEHKQTVVSWVQLSLI